MIELRWDYQPENPYALLSVEAGAYVLQYRIGIDLGTKQHDGNPGVVWGDWIDVPRCPEHP